MGFAQSPALQLYALTSAILGVHLVLLALWTGTARSLKKQFVNPEDSAMLDGAVVEVEHADVLRAKRAHQNALENAVPFFVIAFLYALTSPAPGAARIYFFTFVGARVLHSVFYLWGRQPFRTLSFGVGVLALFGMAFQVIRVVV